MKLIDEHFKDASPLDTVAKIQGILAKEGLSVTEHWDEQSVKNCYALRLSLDGTLFGTNGKGVTADLARASAYAELMERLQAGFLSFGAKDVPSDTKYLDRESLKVQSCDYFSILSDLIRRTDGVSVSPEKLLDTCFEYEGGELCTEARPYYSVTEDKLVYLPTRLVNPIYTSTGNCAGNSPEEAIVQGFSEIIERWFQRQFMCGKYVPPTIPDNYLQQFPLAYESVCHIRQAGYDVLIKDLSMGSGYPVIATAVISKKSHAYHVHCGACPVFEIALQRSLTETFQGRTLQEVTDTSLDESAEGSVSSFRSSFLQGKGSYPLEFFTGDASFPFVPFPDRRQCTNRELLQFVLDFIRQRNLHLYIRDTGIMGFCSYKLIIPEMSNAHFGFLTSDLPVATLQGNTKSIRLNMKEASQEQLLELQLLHLYYLNDHLVDRNPAVSKLLSLPVTADSYKDSLIGVIQIAYVEWECGNKTAGMDYIRQLSQTKVADISDYFSCLYRAVMMCKNQTLESVLQKLSLFYEEGVIDEVRRVITNKRNPFADYVLTCSDHCEGCRYREGCFVSKHQAVADVLGRHVRLFDYDDAMNKISTLFKTL